MNEYSERMNSSDVDATLLENIMNRLGLPQDMVSNITTEALEAINNQNSEQPSPQKKRNLPDSGGSDENIQESTVGPSAKRMRSPPGILLVNQELKRIKRARASIETRINKRGDTKTTICGIVLNDLLVYYDNMIQEYENKFAKFLV